ncbi:hypothetical protein JHL18_22300 [Clostridium sp. YIM B02505]|uniref:Uncharacterized protein n=1 Tax=Clostridium yunnanense TaxID=2800325 RepID=A0ABS1EVJ0_9CLOT|nr:hypothetical protein [Clostridium yunnanense]
MDYINFIIKILVIISSFLIFLKINSKTNLSKFIKKKFKLNTKFRVFIFCAALYCLLTLVTTLMSYYLHIPNVIIQIMDWIALASSIGLFLEINHNVPIDEQSWLG